MTKVLITGMSGLIGGLLRKHLESAGGYELSALNRSRVEGVESHQGDVSDLAAIRPAFDGKEVVVHLAGAVHVAGIPEEPAWEAQLKSNIIGAYNVYEAARQAGVKRVVYASSGNVIRGFDSMPPYDAIIAGRYDEVPPEFPKVTHEMVRPQGIYGAAKAWGEAVGRHFSDAYGLSVLCVRIGQVKRDNRPSGPREASAFISHRDVCQILQRCIDAPDDLKYDIFLATSNNRWGYRDITHARDVLGYEPQDSAEDLV